MKNDDKIKNLLAEINNKKSKMGAKPRAQWKTNGVLKIAGSDGVNINTILSTEKCVELVAKLLSEKNNYTEACKFLGVKESSNEKISYINDSLDDLNLRNQVIMWDAEKRKLDLMESKVKDLRSADAKTEDALNDIEKELM